MPILLENPPKNSNSLRDNKFTSVAHAAESAGEHS